jgi:hypothetical protein
MGMKTFAAGNTLESLRDSDFDSCSVYGEVHTKTAVGHGRMGSAFTAP